MTKAHSSAPLPALFENVAPEFALPNPFDAPPLRWGILGAGSIAGAFAWQVSHYSSQEVVAVGSRDQGRARAFIAQHGVGGAMPYGSYRELVEADDVDIIFVATPHIRHFQDALLALKAGKSVLVEKAFTMNEWQARELFQEARGRGLFVMEAMWSRHLPHYRFLAEVVRSGVLGPLRQLAADHSQQIAHVPRLCRPDLGGGALLDLGVYCLHLQQMLLGVPADFASVTRLADTGVDAADAMIGQYPEALANLTCAMACRGTNQAAIVFERGRVDLEAPFYAPGLVTLTVGDDQETWDARVPGGLQYQAAAAATAMASGNLQSEIVGWQDTLDVMSLMDQVLRSANIVHPKVESM